MSEAIRHGAEFELARRVKLVVPTIFEPLLFSLKTFAAAILALLAAWELEITEPQWAMVTTYLVSQPLLGAIWAKGAFRLVGTLAGAAFAVVCVAAFAQAGPLFILAMALWLAFCVYNATLLRNYPSYGFSLAALSAPLIAFDSVVAPDHVWILAADRATAVTLGILCAGLIHAIVFPRYASDALRRSLGGTFSGLARFAAAVLKPGTANSIFTRLRRKMAGDVIKFDALRSYAVFESPELKGHEAALSRMMRAFLSILSVGRGLYIRLDLLRRHEDRALAERLDPALDRIAVALERIADDTDGARSSAVGAALDVARLEIVATQADLEAMAGQGIEKGEDFETLANGLLVLRRAEDMIESLSRVVAGVTGRLPPEPPGQRMMAVLRPDKGSAVAQAIRGAACILLLGFFWIASAWTAGASAMTGLAIILVIFVIVENPQKLATHFAVGATLATVAGFFCMAFVLPMLGEFLPLAVMLGIFLIPAGVLITSPTYGAVATAFSAFFASQIGLSNLPSYDIGLYIDHSIGFLLGIAAGVAGIALILPYDRARARRAEWTEVVAALPSAARGERPETSARAPIHTALLKLLPRLDIADDADDHILIGTFGMASLSLELIRLSGRIARPAFPTEAGKPVRACLVMLAAAFERLLAADSDSETARIEIVDEAASLVAATRTTLVELASTTPGAEAVDLAHALASLRFIADRLTIDRPFLTAVIR